MHYIIQILAAIVVGTAFGALLGPRSSKLFFGSIVAIALGVAAIFTTAWLPLAGAAAVLFIATALHRDPAPVRA
ncbi:hypothetical protein GSY71_14345 [Pusillimonas sp. TS35]|uniref:hypothetical protein n=1 Tax=Paracandidimonas lactea TaxID=2895524 RepID=UPI001371F81A|nr:hypothetical protein [Paracandidimonas lactea]MYN14320.1 hypothetical protein [Pusillimonas sp. TS35]